MEMGSCISLGTIFAQKYIFGQRDIICVLDMMKQSVRANNYSLSIGKCLPEDIHSIVQKRHKTKPEQANGDY